jgi:prepilin-type N-terminal cleavage/methylation domain-containing protein
MNSTQSRDRIAGFTLIEVSIALTLAAVVAGTAITLFVGLVSSNRQVHEDVPNAIARGRLADRFRNDVAAATGCTALEGKPLPEAIVLQLPDNQSVQYLAVAGEVQRLEYSGDHLDQRDTFRLGDDRRAVFAATADTIPMVSYTIASATRELQPDRLPAAGVKSRPPLTIAAVLGRDWRLAQAVQRGALQRKVDSSPAPSTESVTP